VFLQLGVNCKVVIVVCYYPRSGSLQVREFDDFGLVVSLCVYYGGSVHALFNYITNDESRVLYYGCIANFIGWYNKKA